jgi:hypothetical protein
MVEIKRKDQGAQRGESEKRLSPLDNKKYAEAIPARYPVHETSY